MPRLIDLEESIRDMEYARKTHFEWAEHLESHPDSKCEACDEKPFKMSLERELKWVVKYDRVLRFLRSITK